MSFKIKLSQSLVSQAKLVGASRRRSIAEQVEHWARIGRVMEQNPDLPFSFIREILIADQEPFAGEYQSGV